MNCQAVRDHDDSTSCSKDSKKRFGVSVKKPGELLLKTTKTLSVKAVWDVPDLLFIEETRSTSLK